MLCCIAALCGFVINANNQAVLGWRIRTGGRESIDWSGSLKPGGIAPFIFPFPPEKALCTVLALARLTTTAFINVVCFATQELFGGRSVHYPLLKGSENRTGEGSMASEGDVACTWWSYLLAPAHGSEWPVAPWRSLATLVDKWLTVVLARTWPEWNVMNPFRHHLAED